MSELDIIREDATRIRKYILNKYNCTSGKCIEASDLLAETLLNHFKEHKINVTVSPKNVFVLYENFENCMDCCYEEHWLTKILYKGYPYYIDTTMDQFQWAFSRKLPEIYFDRRLPNFYLNKKPGKVILDRCGWNDWYNTGYYENNFNYWG